MEPEKKPKKNPEKIEERLSLYLDDASTKVFTALGIGFSLSALMIILTDIWALGVCIYNGCPLLNKMLDFVSYLIISVAIFDVGRYLLEEEVLRQRELRSPSEARKSLTKFMVIIVIAINLEALIHVIKAGVKDVTLLIYPVALFFAATFSLIGLGIYQRLSASTEKELGKEDLD